MVFTSEKYNLLSGSAESNFFRKFAAFSTADMTAAQQVSLEQNEPNAVRDVPPLKILLTDRATPADNRRNPSRGRYMANRHELEAVLAKYELPFTFVPDEDLAKMTFEQQAHLFATHSLLITGHGAGMTTNLFMPPRSVVIEISPFNVFCPAYKRMHDAAGHTLLPIYTPMKHHNLDYLHDHGPEENKTVIAEIQTRMSPKCDPLGLLSAVEAECWVEFVQAGIVVPIFEFEEKLLTALDLLGHPRQHRNSAVHMLHGVPSNMTCARRLTKKVVSPVQDGLSWRELNDCAEWTSAPVDFPIVPRYSDYEERMWRVRPGPPATRGSRT